MLSLSLETSIILADDRTGVPTPRSFVFLMRHRSRLRQCRIMAYMCPPRRPLRSGFSTGNLAAAPRVLKLWDFLHLNAK